MDHHRLRILSILVVIHLVRSFVLHHGWASMILSGLIGFLLIDLRHLAVCVPIVLAVLLDLFIILNADLLRLRYLAVLHPVYTNSLLRALLRAKLHRLGVRGAASRLIGSRTTVVRA